MWMLITEELFPDRFECWVLCKLGSTLSVSTAVSHTVGTGWSSHSSFVFSLCFYGTAVSALCTLLTCCSHCGQVGCNSVFLGPYCILLCVILCSNK